MKLRTTSFMLLLLAALILAACKPAGSDPVTINEQDAGKTIELKTGETLIVALDGNITTGYNWVSAHIEPAVLKQVGEAEVTPESDQIGAPGKINLKFKAVEKGQATLHLDYKRPWEKGVTPEKTFEVTVVVK